MKTICPRHDDVTPSCEVYPEFGYCFAGCGIIPLIELGMEVGSAPPKPKEDLYEKREYIKTLPVKEFRGFSFPYDDRGFYICWLDSLYYKKRLFAADGPRYIGPSGHKPPLFWARRSTYREGVLVVEGEIEAISAAYACQDYDVVSPGAASNFEDVTQLTQLVDYNKLIIAVDNDGAGSKAGRTLYQYFMDKVPNLVLLHKSIENDFNDILVTRGRDALNKEIENQVQEKLQRKSLK